MAIPVNQKLDFGNARRITNLAQGAAAGEPVTYDQLQSAIEGLAWKDDVRVASVANITLTAPGATIDGVTMVANDRMLLKNQTTTTENGLYVWNGAATPATRAADASTFDELEGAVVTATEGAVNAGTTWRQTVVNGVIGTQSPTFTAFGTAAPATSETVAGIIRTATQAETDAGALDFVAVSPLKLATYSGRAKRYATNIGDAAATSIVVTHNLGTLDCEVYAYEVGGSKREMLVEKQHTSTNTVTLIFDTAPALNSVRVVVVA